MTSCVRCGALFDRIVNGRRMKRKIDYCNNCYSLYLRARGGTSMDNVGYFSRLQNLRARIKLLPPKLDVIEAVRICEWNGKESAFKLQCARVGYKLKRKPNRKPTPEQIEKIRARVAENPGRFRIERERAAAALGVAEGTVMQWIYADHAPKLAPCIILWRYLQLANRKRNKTPTEEQVRLLKIREYERGRAYRSRPDVRHRRNARVRARNDIMRSVYHSNPQFRIAHCLRVRTRKVLQGKIKSGSTMDLVGCSAAQLKAHLESQFVGRMSWGNYGRAWHIDHVIPLASFDLTKPEQQRLALHYTNLKPLWAKTNMRKGANVSHAQFSLLLPAEASRTYFLNESR